MAKETGNTKMSFISTGELLNELGNPALRLIDIRSPDAYNGWKFRNEKRGGHIEGAKNLPAKWAEYIDWLDIVRSKDILPENSLAIYGYDKGETGEIARRFLNLGYPEVKVYQDFVDQWSGNESLPLRSLARYKNLVPPFWLKSLLDSSRTPEYASGKYVICHVHYRNRADYEKGHIPGAVDIDTNKLESTETWNRRTPSEVKRALLNAGITADTTVILYGRFSNPRTSDPFPGSSAGHLGAMRAALIMLWAGVPDVRILNGGLQSWLDMGFETTTEETATVPADDFGAQIPARPEIIIDTKEAKEVLKSPDKNLVSVRSRAEYEGKVSGYNYIQKKGRIPGSVFADCGSDAYHMQNYRNLDHTMREFPDVEKMWRESGITPDKHNSFYCGTGWRGSEAFLNAWLMGWQDISLYDGGWYEWSKDEENQYETGIPE